MIEDIKYEYRTGLGTDVHRLVEGRKLFLAGLEIPFDLGLLAHSDGDVVIHAVIDALLGAAAMGDIGTFFPDTDPAYKNANSAELLSAVTKMINEEKWIIENLDLTIHAEQPKLVSYKGHMKRRLAEILEINFGSVNVKAKTNEGLGYIGQGQAIAATAIVLLKRRIKKRL